MFRTIRWLLVLNFLFTIVSVEAQRLYQNFEDSAYFGNWSDNLILADTTAFQGTHIGHIDSKQLYSCNLRQEVADELSGRNQQWFFSIAVRPKQLLTGAVFVITFLHSDTLVYYHGVKLDNNLTQADQWCNVSDSFFLPASHTKQLTVKAYIWNKSNANFDVDAIEIKGTELRLPSFIPAIKQQPIPGSSDILFNNSFYQLRYSKKSRSFYLADTSGNALTAPFNLVSIIEKKGRVDTSQITQWKIKSKKIKNDSLIFELQSSNSTGKTTVRVHCSKKLNDIQFEINTQIKRPVKLLRQSLVMNYIDEPEVVYRKNGHCDTQSFQQEYYLGNGGVSIGKKERQLLIPPGFGLSSLQLQTLNKELFLNIDFDADHPLIHFPLEPDSSDYFVDISAFTYPRKHQLFGSFKLIVGGNDLFVPRLLAIPSGYDAAIVWTEHADWTDIRTHRAVNFGHEDIHDIQQAKGGFAAYDIPVTKSVFYNNPDQVTNDDASDQLFKGLHSTIQSDTAFFTFLKQLHEKGHEICLHTPEQYTSTSENMTEALGFMQKHFGSPSWIDHGYNNLESNNRENAICDGLQPESPHYARALWDKFGQRYFWNAATEELNPYRNWGYNGHMELPFSGFGDAFPDRQISIHPAVPEAVMWSTTGTLEVPNDALWDYYFHPQRLVSLIENRSILITHVYPAWVKEGKGYWNFDKDGKVQAMEGFNRTLAKIAALREKRMLLPITNSDLIGYQEAVKTLVFSYPNSNTTLITNNSKQAIKGVSLAVKAFEIEIEGKQFESKENGDDLIFWFNMEAGETVTIVYK